MSQIFFGIAFIWLGGLLYKNATDDKHKKYHIGSARMIELSFYMVLKDYMEMHNYGRKALDMVLEECLNENPSKAEEYKKIIEVYERKFEYLGSHYYDNLQKIIPYDLKYSSYKEIKKDFDNLINKNKEDNNNA